MKISLLKLFNLQCGIIKINVKSLIDIQKYLYIILQVVHTSKVQYLREF